MKTVIAAVALWTSVTSATMANSVPAHADILPDTPTNRQTVAAAVVKLLSPLSVTPPMVEQTDLCNVKITRPGLDFSRSYNFALLDDVVATGHGLSGTLDDPAIDIQIGGNMRNGSASQFTCKIGGKLEMLESRCESSFTIQSANAQQFITVHQAAADIVRVCNPSASYKACPSGLYRGYRCAE